MPTSNRRLNDLLLFVAALALAGAAQLMLAPPASAAVCGGENQSACKLVRDGRLCNPGFSFDTLTGTCLLPRACGQDGQRPCRPVLDSRPTACDAGLVHDRAAQRCVRQLVCGGRNQRPCRLLERVPMCDDDLQHIVGTGKCLPKPAYACGARDQRPCRLFERGFEACDAGLQKDVARHRCVTPVTADTCGNQGQRPCPPRFRAAAYSKYGDRSIKLNGCRTGFVNDPYQGRCVDPAQTLEKVGKKALSEAESFLKMIGEGAMGCVGVAEIREILESQSQDAARGLAQKNCIAEIGKAAHRNGYQTISFGIGGDVSAIVGVGSERGIGFDTSTLSGGADALPTIYASFGYSAGAQLGAGGSVIVSLSKGRNLSLNSIDREDSYGGDSHGFVGSLKALAGGGAAVWFDYDGGIAGFSVFASGGLGANAFAYNRVMTTVARVDEPLSWLTFGLVKGRPLSPEPLDVDPVQVAQENDDAIAGPSGPQVVNIDPQGFTRIRNRWQRDQFLHVENGGIESGAAPTGWYSAMWTVEPVPGTTHVRLRNRWKSDEYLHVEHGRLASGPIQTGWHSAMWTLESASGFTKIRNRWKSDQYLNVEHGELQSGPIQPGWHSAMWVMEPVR